MKVEVLNVEESKYLYSTRILKIGLHGKTIETPLRVLTHADLNAKSEIPSEVMLPSEISAVFRRLTTNETKKILDKNKYIERIIKSLEDYRQRMQHSLIVFSILQPAGTAIGDILINEKLKDRFMKLVLKIQLNAGLDYITVPWLNFSPEKTIAVFKKIERALEKIPGREPIFCVDVSLDPPKLERVIEFIRDLSTTGIIHFLGLLYRPAREALASYELLWDMLKETNIAVILAGVERYDEDLMNISGVHMHEFILGDILVPEVKRPFGLKKAREKRIEERVRFFVRRSLQVFPIARLSKTNWIDEVTELIKDRRVKQILENYPEAEKDDEKRKVLTSVSKVHEYLASYQEFDYSREFIYKGEPDEYIKEKDTLYDVLRIVRGQRKLY